MPANNVKKTCVVSFSLTSLLLMVMLWAFAFFTPSFCAAGELVVIEGENYYDGPSNTLEAVSDKPTASGGKCLSGHCFGKAGRVTRYQLSSESDYTDARLLIRYSRDLWYKDQPTARVKLTLANIDKLITRQLDCDATGGWATDEPSQWAFLDVEIGFLDAGKYMLQFESLNKTGGDICIDFIMLSDGNPTVDLERLAFVDRLDLNVCRYVGISVDKKILTRKQPIRVELPLGAFSEFWPDVSVELLDKQTGTKDVIYKYWGNFPIHVNLIGPDSEINRISFMAEEFKALPDGNYSLICKWRPWFGAMAEPMKIDITVASELAASLPEKISMLEDFYQNGILKGKAYNAAAFQADYAHAIEFLKTTYQMLVKGNADAALVDNVRRTLRQFTLTTELLDHNYSPYAGLKGDLRFAQQANPEAEVKPYRVFLPEVYTPQSQIPCIIALGSDENMYLDMSSGIFKKIANERGYAVIAVSTEAKEWASEAKSLSEFIDSACKRLSGIDTASLYCLGASHSGFTAYSMAVDYPELFSAIACVNGVGDRIIVDNKRKWRNKPSPVPVLIIQGGTDNIVPPRWANIISASLAKEGVESQLRYFPSNGHGFDRYSSEYFNLIFEFFDSYQAKDDQSE